jgi:HlyD family secretion protein
MTRATTPSERNLGLLLGDQAVGRRKWYVLNVAVAGLLLVLGVSYSILRSHGVQPASPYETEPVSRGTLHLTVAATGNLQPTKKVEVGSELSGIVESVLVQENDHVKKGQVLARLDASRLRDQANQTEAALLSAQAKLAQAEATQKESSANLERLRDARRLSGGKVPSKTEMATAEATLARAVADRSSARAAVDQTRAALSSDQISLSKAAIRSPIDGIVLSRSAEPGQTVAASLQVATLFTIAGDLRQMQLKVDVDEADVGTVKEGQPASFTVDAYPGREYHATVIRIAFGSQTKDNVVSYSTILKVDNGDLSLRPGMTATAQITTAARQNVLLVPNEALRFTPSPDSQTQQGGLLGRLMPRPPNGSTRQTAASMKGNSQLTWTLREGHPVSIAVTTGATDGTFTQITGGDLREGMRVITDDAAPAK